MKNYYHILNISRYASQEEIKRSYRRLASRYHPDVNSSPDAHYVFVEINEAYEVLGDPTQKWIYDQQFERTEHIVHTSTPVFTSPPTSKKEENKRRRGKKETAEEKLEKKRFALRRNIVFNRKMKWLSCLSLIFALSIFIDHYLPTQKSIEHVAYGFEARKNMVSKNVSYSIIAHNIPISLLVNNVGVSPIALKDNQGLFAITPIWKVLTTVQIGDVVFEPENGLHALMFLYGFVCLASLFVLSYKLENDLFYPAFITFFCNIFVASFVVLKITM